MEEKTLRPISALALLTLLLAAPDAHAFDHSRFDAILKAHVRAGRVDYAAIKARAKADLDAYVTAVGGAKIDGLSRDAKLAFYLNAYNAMVIKAVVERWPNIESVIKVSGFFDGARYRVAGRSVTLNQLEKKIILPTFKEPRVHFALVCAARSCPPLRARAFAGRGLSRVLEGLTKRFVNSNRGVRMEGGRVSVSKLFQWYAKDFGDVKAFLARYHDRHAAAIKAASSLAYLHYDWALNKLSSVPR